MSLIKNDNVKWIASFDIGSKNLCFCIEQYPLNIQINIEPKFNLDGTPTDLYKSQLDDFYKLGKVILYVNKDITENCDKSKYFNSLLYHNMYKHLDDYKDYWNLCDDIIVEEQMWSGINRNPKACRLEQHCLSYFIFFYSKFKNIQNFPAYNKTQVLGAPKDEIIHPKTGKKRYKAMSKPDRKKWSIKHAEYVLNIRNDTETLKCYSTSRGPKGKKIKLDDISDTILQSISYNLIKHIE